MTGWRWLDKQALLPLQGVSLTEHGGTAGMRDEGFLDSALARAPDLAAYDDSDVAALAAAYGSGVARNHLFIDGNEHAAFFLSVSLFLFLNDYRLVATQVGATKMVLAHGAGDIGEAEFAAWLRQHFTRRAAPHGAGS